MRSPVVVLGVPIDPLNMPQALERIHDMVQIGRSTGKVHQVATANVDFVVQAAQDPELRYLLQRADLISADGMPLVWGIRALGFPLQDRVAGADLVPTLAAYAANWGFSIYFFGAAPGVAERAASLLKQKHPELRIAGVHAPPFRPILEMDTSFLEEIRQAKPDILLVALGNPKQEKWIGMFGRRLGVPVMIGVGGSLDFLAGTTHRAPLWMQKSGLEWLYRLLQEPRRLFRRYVIDLAIFGPAFLRQWFAIPRAAGPGGADLIIQQGKPILILRGHLHQDNLQALQRAGQQALEISPSILVNLEKTLTIDSSAVGVLLDLSNQAREAGGEISLAAVPAPILNTLSLLKMEKLFPIYQDTDAYFMDHSFQKNLTSQAASWHPSDPAGHCDWTVLHAGHILDSTTSLGFFETGACLLETKELLIIDLAETIFLTSAGLAALQQLRQIAQKRNGEIKLIHCSQDTVCVLKKAKYDHLFPIYSDLYQALV